MGESTCVNLLIIRTVHFTVCQVLQINCLHLLLDQIVVVAQDLDNFVNVLDTLL